MEGKINIRELTKDTPNLKICIQKAISQTDFNIVDYDYKDIARFSDDIHNPEYLAMRTTGHVRNEAWWIARCALSLVPDWDFIVGIMKMEPIVATAIAFEANNEACFRHKEKSGIELKEELIPRIRKAEQDGEITFDDPRIFCRDLDMCFYCNDDDPCDTCKFVTEDREEWTFDLICRIERIQFQRKGCNAGM